MPEPGQELGALGAALSKPPAPGVQETAEVHLTRVHEVETGNFFERNYTLYTLQYELSWLPSPKGEIDRRYSDFEAFHGEIAYTC